MSAEFSEIPICNPPHFDILNPRDKEDYIELQKQVGSPENRYNRNKRIETLKEIFEKIKKYCIHNDADDWKRCLVCGICWFQDAMAINIRNLKILILKSKSTINGALAKMGYTTVPNKGIDLTNLLKTIPSLHNSEIRQWTIRKSNQDPQEQENNEQLVMNTENNEPIFEEFSFDDGDFFFQNNSFDYNDDDFDPFFNAFKKPNEEQDQTFCDRIEMCY